MAKGYTPNNARDAYGWTSALQHYHVELTLGLDQILWWAEQHDLIWNMCYAEFVCKHAETGEH